MTSVADIHRPEFPIHATSPRIASSVIGTLSVSKMTIETPDGKRLSVDTDYRKPGPFLALPGISDVDVQIVGPFAARAAFQADCWGRVIGCRLDGTA